MSDEPVLLSEDKGAVRLLTLNRPTKLNALNSALEHAILDAVDAANADDSIAVIIIAANGRAFSAGADLKEAATRADETNEQKAARTKTMRAMYELGNLTHKPIIAVVRGYALGGGCNLAISADMVVAGENAIFGYPEVKAGLVASSVTPGLLHRIGPKTAFEMLTVCENISASRALEIGLINRVVADDDALATAFSMADILCGFDQHALRETKRIFLESKDLTLSESLDVIAQSK